MSAIDRYNAQYEAHDVLLQNIKDNLPKLKELYESVSSHWGYEDMIYRFYHHSFKVYWLQGSTMGMFKALLKCAPPMPWLKEEQKRWDNSERQQKWGPRPKKINHTVINIVKEGTGKTFDVSHNKEWNKNTKPIVEAFFHLKFFLEMAIKYGEELEEAPQLLPSGWAALLYFYNLR